MDVYVFGNTNKDKILKSFNKLLDKLNIDVEVNVKSLKEVD